MIDGVHFGEHLCVVALGIGIDGTKHPLGLVEGSTENTTVVTDRLIGLRDRGLDTTRPIFVGIDGAKAERTAVVRVFDHPVIVVVNCARSATSLTSCLITSPRPSPSGCVCPTTRTAALAAEAQLEALAKELDRTYP